MEQLKNKNKNNDYHDELVNFFTRSLSDISSLWPSHPEDQGEIGKRDVIIEQQENLLKQQKNQLEQQKNLLKQLENENRMLQSEIRQKNQEKLESLTQRNKTMDVALSVIEWYKSKIYELLGKNRNQQEQVDQLTRDKQELQETLKQIKDENTRFQLILRMHKKLENKQKSSESWLDTLQAKLIDWGWGKQEDEHQSINEFD